MPHIFSFNGKFNFGVRALAVVAFASLLLPLLLSAPSSATPKKPKPETPKNSIFVKSFEWQSGGMGRPGVIREITIENRGKNTYSNIEIEAEFFSDGNAPLGSLRATVKDVIEPGAEKTFYNLSFGLMHSELRQSVLRVVKAELIESGSPALPKDLILVKNWQWEAGQYGTEGILKEITLQNTSANNYKDIKIKVNNLGVGGPKLGIKEGYTSVAVIHKVLPAGSTKTFREINVGFKHPDTKNTLISVINAEEIGLKELKFRIAEDGIPVKRGTRVKSSGEGSSTVLSAEEDGAPSEKQTLADRYKKKIAAKDGGVKDANAAEPSAKSKPKGELVEREIASRDSETPEALSEEEFAEEQTGIVGRVSSGVSRIGKSIVGIFKGDDDGEDQAAESGADDGSLTVEDDDAFKSSVSRDSVEVYEEEEEAFPQQDIIVKEFELKSGITGTIGVLKEIVLENRSGITYRNIELSVDFYSRTGSRNPLGSNRIKILGILPPQSEKIFRDVSIGFLNFTPEEIEISVLNAQY
ncbi:MAG: hypothetical protein ACT4NX_08690 [Deltaproteobacteria bacterium]